MRKFAVALALLAMVLSGCGLAEKAADKVAEKAAEKAVEAATGVKVESDKNSVTVKGKDGEQVTFSNSEDGKIPEGFPLPVYRGAKVLSGSDVKSEGKTLWVVELQVKGDVTDVADFYEKAFQERGFEISRTDTDTDGEKMSLLMGESDKESTMTTINSEDGVVTIGIMIGDK